MPPRRKTIARCTCHSRRNRLGYITDGVALMLGAQLTEDKHNREA